MRAPSGSNHHLCLKILSYPTLNAHSAQSTTHVGFFSPLHYQSAPPPTPASWSAPSPIIHSPVRRIRRLRARLPARLRIPALNLPSQGFLQHYQATKPSSLVPRTVTPAMMSAPPPAQVQPLAKRRFTALQLALVGGAAHWLLGKLLMCPHMSPSMPTSMLILTVLVGQQMWRRTVQA